MQMCVWTGGTKTDNKYKFFIIRVGQKRDKTEAIQKLQEYDCLVLS